jgi:hypothetical protein
MDVAPQKKNKTNKTNLSMLVEPTYFISVVNLGMLTIQLN